jgi:hypothetical protein
MITSWTRAIDSRVTHLSILTIFQDFPFVQRYKPFPPRGLRGANRYSLDSLIVFDLIKS